MDDVRHYKKLVSCKALLANLGAQLSWPTVSSALALLAEHVSSDMSQYTVFFILLTLSLVNPQPYSACHGSTIASLKLNDNCRR